MKPQPSVRHVQAIMMAKLGMSDKTIMHATGYTKGQVRYRLFKAKKDEGYADGVGYRNAWRNGESREVKLVMRHVGKELAGRIQRSLPPIQ